MAAVDHTLELLHHPCPRQRHHPGEHCSCAKRLDVHVPHGYSRAGDHGSVHAARLQNLRWRLASSVRGGGPGALPASLCALAEDIRDDTDTRCLRPLSPVRPQPHSVGVAVLLRCRCPSAPQQKERRMLLGCEFCFEAQPRRAGTPGTDDLGINSSSSAPAPPLRRPKRNVSFNDRLEVEVPVILPAQALRLARMVPRRGEAAAAFRGTPIAAEDHARANLCRLRNNHNRVVDMFGDCFAFLGAQRAALRDLQTLLQARLSRRCSAVAGPTEWQPVS